jgi:tetratricopeptide (TPR) repeat protein
MSRFLNPWWATGLLVVVTVSAYLPVFNGGFIWDDNVYVFTNPLVTSSDGLHDIWLTAKSIEYYPMFYSTLWLEWKLWGMDAAGYHTVNILLHVMNVLLVWRVLKSLGLGGALLGALLFAVHPVNVESVAWISELKNTLSLLFFLLACLAWLRFRQEAGGRGIYALALIYFLAALLSKTTAVVFPVFMLGLAWWRDGGITRRDVRLSLPFFVLALGMGLLLIWFLPHRYPSEDLIREAGLIPRVAGAGLASWFYVGKVIFPKDLCLVYPHWGLDIRNPLVLLPMVALLGAFVLLWLRRSGWGRPLLMGVGFFWISLLPALGIIVHPYLKQSPVADRWLYLPLIGLAGLAAAGWHRWLFVVPGKKRNLALLFAALVVVLFGSLTFRRAGLFADAEALYRETLDINPAAAGVRNNLALVLINRGEREAAIAELRKVTADDPGYAGAWNNLGNLILGAGRPREALPILERALELDPESLQVKLNLGLALAEVGRVEQAVVLLQEAAAGIGNNTVINLRLAEVLLEAGHPAEAATVLAEVLAREPANLRVAYRLAGARVAEGDRSGAIAVYQDIVRGHPDEFGALVNLGNMYSQTGRGREAVQYYESALRVKPELPGALDNLAWLLATHPDPQVRNGDEALRLAREGARLAKGGHPRVLETLAAAQAATGDFESAVASQSQALALMRDKTGPARLASAEARLIKYQNREPWIAPEIPPAEGR